MLLLTSRNEFLRKFGDFELTIKDQENERTR